MGIRTASLERLGSGLVACCALAQTQEASGTRASGGLLPASLPQGPSALGEMGEGQQVIRTETFFCNRDPRPPIGIKVLAVSCVCYKITKVEIVT